MTDPTLNRARTFLGSTISILGILGLLGWVTGLRVLASIHADLIPMAPGTSLSFLALGVVLLIELQTQKHSGRKIVSLVVGFISLYGFLNFLEYVAGVNLTFTNVFFPTTERLGGFPVDRMSPVSGALLFLSGVALELRIWANNRKGITNVIASVGLLTFTIGSIATLGYVYGTPLLYGSNIIPLAATTSLCFLLLGIGFILMLGDESFLLKYIVGNSPRAQLLRGLVPAIVFAFLLDGLLDARVFSRLYFSRPLISSLESMVFAVVVGAFAVRISHTIFRDAEEAEGKRKRAEDALRESEERFRSLFENVTIGLYRTAPDGRILLANPALIRMLGYHSFDELVQRNLEEEGFEPSYSRSQFRHRLEQESEIRGLESAWTRRDGSVAFVRESAKAVRNTSGGVVWYEGTVEDITERKRAEEEQKKLVAALQDALAEVKTLGGLIPICSSCKKIRDDKGYWNILEAYLMDHSEAQFTHGMCPECMAKLYPSIAEK